MHGVHVHLVALFVREALLRVQHLEGHPCLADVVHQRGETDALDEAAIVREVAREVERDEAHADRVAEGELVVLLVAREAHQRGRVRVELLQDVLDVAERRRRVDGVALAGVHHRVLEDTDDVLVQARRHLDVEHALEVDHLGLEFVADLLLDAVGPRAAPTGGLAVRRQEADGSASGLVQCEVGDLGVLDVAHPACGETDEAGDLVTRRACLERQATRLDRAEQLDQTTGRHARAEQRTRLEEDEAVRRADLDARRRVLLQHATEPGVQVVDGRREARVRLGVDARIRQRDHELVHEGHGARGLVGALLVGEMAFAHAVPLPRLPACCRRRIRRGSRRAARRP